MIDLTDIPDFARVESLHQAIAPSKAAYDLIHLHCLVVATIAWQIARNQNQLLAKARGEALPSACVERSHLASQAMCALLEQHIGSDPLPPLCKSGQPGTHYVDEYLTCIGALLHDIGTYTLLLPEANGVDGASLQFDGPRYIWHGLRGYEYLLNAGVAEIVASFARNHTGVGLTRSQVVAQRLLLPPDDYLPVNVEQEIVMVADKYNSKSVPPRFLTVEAYERKAQRFGQDNAHQWTEYVEQYGCPDVFALAQRFAMQVDQ